MFRSKVPRRLVCILNPEIGESPVFMVPVEIASWMYMVPVSMISWFPRYMFPAPKAAVSVKLIVSIFGLLGIFGGLGFGSLVFAMAMADSTSSSRRRAVIITVLFGISASIFVLNRKTLLSTMVFA